MYVPNLDIRYTHPTSTYFLRVSVDISLNNISVGPHCNMAIINMLGEKLIKHVGGIGQIIGI